MKPDIHPKYHDVTFFTADGDEFTTRSTYGKPGDRVMLDVSYKTHPAWTGNVSHVNQKASQVAKFNKRFSGITMFGNDDNKEEESN